MFVQITETGARLLLVVIVTMLIGFFAIRGPNIAFETELLDLASIDTRDALSDRAVKELGREFQSRITFLIQGGEADRVAEAEALLREKLREVEGLVLSDSIAAQQRVISAVSASRFHLLSEAQRQVLEMSDRTRILNSLAMDRIGLGATAQLFDITIDPLAWHSRTVSEIVTSIVPGTLFTNDSVVTSVSARLSSEVFEVEEQQALKQRLLFLASSVEDAVPNITILAGGVFFHAATAASDSRSDVIKITSIATVGVVALLFALFRSLHLLVVPVCSVAVGIASGFAAAYSMFSGLHVITLIFGASLIGVVIDYSLHFFIHERLSSGNESRSGLYRALILSLITSVLAYSVLGGSGQTILIQVAVFSAFGLSAALVCVIALCPLIKRNAKLHDGWILAFISKAKPLLSKIPARAIVITTFVGLVGSIYIRDWVISSGNDPSKFVRADQQQLQIDRRIGQATLQFEPGTFLLISGANAADIFVKTEAFFQRIEQEGSIDTSRFVTLTTVIPSPQGQRGNYDLSGRIYGPDGLVDDFMAVMSLSIETAGLKAAYANSQNQLLEPSELSLAMKDVFPPLWFRDESGAELSVTLIPQGVDLALLAKVSGEIDGVSLSNVLDISREGLRSKKAAGLALFLPLSFLVAGFLLAVYRRASAGLIVIVPVLSVSVVIGLFTLLGYPVTLFQLMALYLAVGLGLDYSIFVYEIRSEGQLAERAISVSAITSLLSFGLLGLSGIPVVSGFGLTLLLANSVNLMGALWLAAWLRDGPTRVASPTPISSQSR
jgi:predicted exporter